MSGSILKNKSIAFIGAGNMAEAIIRGLLRAEVCPPQRIIATAPRAERRAELHHRYGVSTVADNTEAAVADVVVLGVKPQVLPSVLDEIAGSLTSETLVVSLAAGIKLAQIQSRLPGDVKVVRAMPNLPVTIFEGVTVYSCDDAVPMTAQKIVAAMFESVGTTYALDESLMDAVTAFSGSGPAFVFRFVEALSDAASQIGIPESAVAPMAIQTLLGSAKMLAQSDDSAVALRAKVCSKGGTALAGLSALQAGGFEDAIQSCLRAANQRAKELSEMAEA